MELQSLSETENFIQLALEHEQTGDISGALRLARQALNMARANDLPLASAQALTAVARYRFRLGQYKIAHELAQEALEMTDTFHDAQAAVHIEALLLLGMCALKTSSLAECEQYYRSAANLAREIAVMNADGSNLTRLTNNPSADCNPIWSPDGKQILFTSNRNQFVNMFVMDANGANQRQLTFFNRANNSLQSTCGK